MSYNSLSEGSVVLRLEFSIADAVHQRGLLSVIGSAISAWWNRPRLPADIPANLRMDIGLSPLAETAHWLDIPSRSGIPDPCGDPGCNRPGGGQYCGLLPPHLIIRGRCLLRRILP